LHLAVPLLCRTVLTKKPVRRLPNRLFYLEKLVAGIGFEPMTFRL
jgi:hypothetical protein